MKSEQTRTAAEIAAQVAANPYAWPGGYPTFAITDDGAALCPTCCKEEEETIAESFPGDGWHVIAQEINWEDPELLCDHCGERIESAYTEPEEENTTDTNTVKGWKQGTNL